MISQLIRSYSFERDNSVFATAQPFQCMPVDARNFIDGIYWNSVDYRYALHLLIAANSRLLHFVVKFVISVTDHSAHNSDEFNVVPCMLLHTLDITNKIGNNHNS